MSKHDENEDKRRRRFIGWFFGPLALAGLFAVLGFVLGNASANSAMGADNTNVIALPVAGCLDSPESATYLAASFKSQNRSVDVSTSNSTSDNATGSSTNGTPAVTNDFQPNSAMNFDTAVAVIDDGANVTPTSDPTVTPDPAITPDPAPTTQPGEDCDHSGHGEHDGHSNHDGQDGHHDGDHHSSDC